MCVAHVHTLSVSKQAIVSQISRQLIKRFGTLIIIIFHKLAVWTPHQRKHHNTVLWLH